MPLTLARSVCWAIVPLALIVCVCFGMVAGAAVNNILRNCHRSCSNPSDVCFKRDKSKLSPINNDLDSLFNPITRYNSSPKRKTAKQENITKAVATPKHHSSTRDPRRYTRAPPRPRETWICRLLMFSDWCLFVHDQNQRWFGTTCCFVPSWQIRSRSQRLCTRIARWHEWSLVRPN